ncbi:MAG: hypothetical protein HQL75_14050 [Magnetococcales bacterium]|nr:hypothetical protein [Magnetococcales bacterium]
MNAKFKCLKSDMQRVDAHVITPEEYEEIPELPPEFFTEGALYREGIPVISEGAAEIFRQNPVVLRDDLTGTQVFWNG